MGSEETTRYGAGYDSRETDGHNYLYDVTAREDDTVVVRDERWLVGTLLAFVLVGVANTVFHVLARQLLFASINGTACVVALWAVYRIFLEE